MVWENHLANCGPAFAKFARQMPFSSSIERAAQISACLFQNAPEIDFEGAFPTREFELMREAGLLSAPIPPQFGGDGLGTAPASTPDLLRVLWHIGAGNLAVGRLYEGHVNALQLIHYFGSKSQKARFFGEARDGKIFAVWNTQAENGIEFLKNENGVEMRGAKTFCSGAGHVLRPIVSGERIENGEKRGWQMAVVPMEKIAAKIDDSWWKPLGMRASASFQVDFSGATIERDDWLGAAGDYYAQPAFSGGAIRFCAVQLGGAASLFDAAREFLRQCGRENDPFQRARMGQIAAKTQSGLMWIEKAGQLWDAQCDDAAKADAAKADAAQMVAFAAMMRVATEEICVQTLEMVEKSVGARGLLRPHPFERIGRDLRLYLKQPHLDEIPGRIGAYALQNPRRSDELFAT